jgi:hypothetical protein
VGPRLVFSTPVALIDLVTAREKKTCSASPLTLFSSLRHPLASLSASPATAALERGNMRKLLPHLPLAPFPSCLGTAAMGPTTSGSGCGGSEVHRRKPYLVLALLQVNRRLDWHASCAPTSQRTYTGGATHLQVTGGVDCTSHGSISCDSQILSPHSRGSRIKYFGCSTYAPIHPSATSFYSEV